MMDRSCYRRTFKGAGRRADCKVVSRGDRFVFRDAEALEDLEEARCLMPVVFKQQQQAFQSEDAYTERCKGNEGP